MTPPHLNDENIERGLFQPGQEHPYASYPILTEDAAGAVTTAA
ncbi:hypothetical protein ACPF7Z_09575 [Halomonas sp. GXIMD04776]